MSTHVVSTTPLGHRIGCDFPNVTSGIAKAGGADPGGSIHRPVQHFDTARFQVVDHPIHVVDKERELKADTRVTLRNRRRRNKPGRITRLQQVDECVAELEGGRIVVLGVNRELKTSRYQRFAAGRSSTNSVIAKMLAGHDVCAASSRVFDVLTFTFPPLGVAAQRVTYHRILRRRRTVAPTIGSEFRLWTTATLILFSTQAATEAGDQTFTRRFNSRCRRAGDIAGHPCRA
jgi:hypothetical protein